MSLLPGDPASDFTLSDQNGARVTLSALWKQGPVVLFFYPKDMTTGCTREVCAFRDQYEAFKTAGAFVVGISSQGTESKKQFAELHRLPFTLVADEGGVVRRAYGVKPSLFGLIDGRETYVIDTHGIVRHVFNSQVNPTRHVAEALEVLKTLGARSPAQPAPEIRSP
jgi:thioredoxin-dependent peroxiredoxin